MQGKKHSQNVAPVNVFLEVKKWRKKIAGKKTDETKTNPPQKMVFQYQENKLS